MTIQSRKIFDVDKILKEQIVIEWANDVLSKKLVTGNNYKRTSYQSCKQVPDGGRIAAQTGGGVLGWGVGWIVDAAKGKPSWVPTKEVCETKYRSSGGDILGYTSIGPNNLNKEQWFKLSEKDQATEAGLIFKDKRYNMKTLTPGLSIVVGEEGESGIKYGTSIPVKQVGATEPVKILNYSPTQKSTPRHKKNLAPEPVEKEVTTKFTSQHGFSSQIVHGNNNSARTTWGIDAELEAKLTYGIGEVGGKIAGSFEKENVIDISKEETKNESRDESQEKTVTTKWVQAANSIYEIVNTVTTQGMSLPFSSNARIGGNVTLEWNGKKYTKASADLLEAAVNRVGGNGLITRDGAYTNMKAAGTFVASDVTTKDVDYIAYLKDSTTGKFTNAAGDVFNLKDDSITSSARSAAVVKDRSGRKMRVGYYVDATDNDNSIIHGSNKSDYFRLPEKGGKVNTYSGNDIVKGSSRRDLIDIGSKIADFVSVTAGKGADVINAGKGSHIIDAGIGKDIVNLTTSAKTTDQITLGKGADILNINLGKKLGKYANFIISDLELDDTFELLSHKGKEIANKMNADIVGSAIELKKGNKHVGTVYGIVDDFYNFLNSDDSYFTEFEIGAMNAGLMLELADEIASFNSETIRPGFEGPWAAWIDPLIKSVATGNKINLDFEEFSKDKDLFKDNLKDMHELVFGDKALPELVDWAMDKVEKFDSMSDLIMGLTKQTVLMNDLF